jgi:IS1 family transposase
LGTEADTKLVPCWHVGRRDAQAASEFINDLASRLAHRVMLTTDGFRPYLEAVESAFGADIDYAMLRKVKTLKFGAHNILRLTSKIPHHFHYHG